MTAYELRPNDGHKSFYGKAIVTIDDNGVETPLSYYTKICERHPDGIIKKLWNGWSATTGRHIAAFCGLNKKAWEAL